MRRNSGFTFMELMVTIAVLAILAAVAVPNLIGWMPKFRLGSGSRDLLSILQKTRLQAIKDNTTYFVVMNTANESFAIHLDDGNGTPDVAPADGIPDGANNGIFEATETRIRQETMPGGVNITNTTLPGNTVAFDNQGLASAAGVVNIRSDAGNYQLGRRITIQLAGSTNLAIVE